MKELRPAGLQVLRTCVGNVDSCTEGGPVILQGHTKGNTFKHYWTYGARTA